MSKINSILCAFVLIFSLPSLCVDPDPGEELISKVKDLSSIFNEVTSENLIFPVFSERLEDEYVKTLYAGQIKNSEKLIVKWSSYLPELNDYIRSNGFNDKQILASFSAYKTAHNKAAEILYQYHSMLKSGDLRNVGAPSSNEDKFRSALEYVNKSKPVLEEQKKSILAAKQALESRRFAFLRDLFTTHKKEKESARKLIVGLIDIASAEIDILISRISKLHKTYELVRKLPEKWRYLHPYLQARGNSYDSFSRETLAWFEKTEEDPDAMYQALDAVWAGSIAPGYDRENSLINHYRQKLKEAYLLQRVH